MTNLYAHLKHNTINLNSPKQHKTQQADYWKLKNKSYYQATKEKRKNDENESKHSLIYYYKKKLGDDVVIYLVRSLGLANAIKQMKKMKSDNNETIIEL
jgi:hypothetical protein